MQSAAAIICQSLTQALGVAALALGAFSSTPVSAANALDQFSIHLDSRSAPDLRNLVGDAPLSIPILAQLSNSADGYEAFLAALKATAPELFKRPVLLHQSGSLQHASFDSPRVLLFGRGTVLTFAEDPARPARDVEILSFNPTSSRFEAAEIRFKPGVRPEVRINPPVCAACHGRGAELRPLWQPYDIWPGAYGAQAGLLRGTERKAYERFIDSPDRQGIHREIELARPRGAIFKLETLDNFSEYLSSLSMLRTMGELKRRLGPAHPMRYALTAALNGCALSGNTGRGSSVIPISEFIPAPLRSRMTLSAHELEQDTLDARKSMAEQLRSQYERYFPGSAPDFSITSRLDFETGVVGPARFVLENLGIEWSSFTMSQGENRVSIQVPSLLPMDLGTALAAFDPSLFSELNPEKILNNGLEWRRFDCEALKGKSLQALSAAAPVALAPLQPQMQRIAGSGLAPMARCAQCHVHEAQERGVPLLPFDQTVKLGEWLRVDSNLARMQLMIRSGEMPQDSHLESIDQDALIEALERITEQAPPQR